MTTPTREIHLASRPFGWPTHDDFRTVETELPDPGPGEVLVRNTFLSVDPYMRGRMNDVQSYVPPFHARRAAGRAARSARSSRPATTASPSATTVLHQAGWREHALLPARAGPRGRRQPACRPSAYLGVLGMPGLTAYVGLSRIARGPGGRHRLRLGRRRRRRLAWPARSPGCRGAQGRRQRPARRRRSRWLTDELGFDAAFDYKDGPVARAAARRGADGIDVYFDNVGGEHLEAAISALADFGRVALCGAIATYNDDRPVPGPAQHVPGRRQAAHACAGSSSIDHGDLAGEFYRRGRRLVRRRHADATRRRSSTGSTRTVDAFLGLHRGDNTGKMLVRL